MVVETGISGLVWIDEVGGRLATINKTPGISYYKEEIRKINNVEYRIWNPYKSKLSAAFLKGLELDVLNEVKKILYLGASTGTTISHLSDILPSDGVIYAVEVAPRVMMEFINRIVKNRNNVIPLFYDARMPENYIDIVDVDVDMVYCDVAQPDQTKIALDNADTYLKPGGKILLAIKARSIDAVKPLKQIYENEVKEIRKRGYKIVKLIDLEPFEKEHAMVYALKE